MKGRTTKITWAKFETFYDKAKSQDENLDLWESLKIIQKVFTNEKLYGYIPLVSSYDARKIIAKNKAP